MDSAGHEFSVLSHRVIGAASAVHRQLGPGFLESIYEAALAVELRSQAICFETQKEIVGCYRGQEVGRHRLDLVVQGELIVELKAVRELADVHFAQLRSYLRGTGLRAGLLMNFAAPTLEVKRVVN